MLDKTMVFSLGGNRDDEMKEALITVYNALKKKGYNPINQIVGYILLVISSVRSTATTCSRSW